MRKGKVLKFDLAALTKELAQKIFHGFFPLSTLPLYYIS